MSRAITLVRRTILAALLLASGAPVAAQLYGGTSPRIPHGPMNIWFGAARDSAGRYIANTTIVLATRQIDFVAVTDQQGRFRLELPLAIRPADVRARCSHRAYPAARIVRRLPRGAAATPVEITCQLG